MAKTCEIDFPAWISYSTPNRVNTIEPLYLTVSALFTGDGQHFASIRPTGYSVFCDETGSRNMAGIVSIGRDMESQIWSQQLNQYSVKNLKWSETRRKHLYTLTCGRMSSLFKSKISPIPKVCQKFDLLCWGIFSHRPSLFGHPVDMSKVYRSLQIGWKLWMDGEDMPSQTTVFCVGNFNAIQLR